MGHPVEAIIRVWESGEHGRSGGRSSDRGQHGAKYQAGFPVGGQRQLDPPLQYWQAQAVAMEWRLCVGCLIFRCRADHHRGETVVM
jgi:hypothetical protein